MVPFGEADSDRFYGRESEVEELVQRLRVHPFLTVIGPSGSGKSSLVFAGLVPALRRSTLFGPGEWLVRSLRPGELPRRSLAEALRGVDRPNGHRLLLVVDQFEELFTLARDADTQPLQQMLQRLIQAPNCYVVLTARADFYPDLMATPLWGRSKRTALRCCRWARRGCARLSSGPPRTWAPLSSRRWSSGW
jgi:hypothetical protein